MGTHADHNASLWLMQAKLLHQADRTLELLEVDEAKFADELTLQQQELVATINALAMVGPETHTHTPAQCRLCNAFSQ